MKIGMIGLGRMGSNMAVRLMRAGHSCVVYDRDPQAVGRLAQQGAEVAASIEELAAKLPAPRAVWLMLPAAAVDPVLAELKQTLEAGDTIVEGGNSNYRDDIRRAAELEPAGIHYIDVGVSGGVWGLDRGYCLMIGGEPEPVQAMDPIWAALAPGADAAQRTAGRTGTVSPSEQGYLHCGPNGAGHFVKMVHNGVEYGMMAAIAEGLNILDKADAGKRTKAVDAETAPMRHPEDYQYDIDLPEVAEVWRRGSVIGSWLLDLTATALHEDPQLGGFTGRVSDSGEGRWTVLAAVDEGVPAPVISTALDARFGSRGRDELADKLMSAMRYEFGGHLEKEPQGAAG